MCLTSPFSQCLSPLSADSNTLMPDLVFTSLSLSLLDGHNLCALPSSQVSTQIERLNVVSTLICIVKHNHTQERCCLLGHAQHQSRSSDDEMYNVPPEQQQQGSSTQGEPQHNPLFPFSVMSLPNGDHGALSRRIKRKLF